MGSLHCLEIIYSKSVQQVYGKAMCWESQNVQLNNLADAPKVRMK
jgi:hypothetical protein